MSSDSNQKIFQTVDSILQELDQKDRLLLKDVAQRVADETGLSLSGVKPVVQLYIKSNPKFVIKNGRNGGIRKVATNITTTVVTSDDVANV